MTSPVDLVVNFLYDTWGGQKQENIKALAEVIECWEEGRDVYIKDKFGGGTWIKPPSPATQPSGLTTGVQPNWFCGCGAQLHGDEIVCWRCGGHKKP